MPPLDGNEKEVKERKELKILTSNNIVNANKSCT